MLWHGLLCCADCRCSVAIPGINDLFFDEPFPVHLDAGVDITAHGADGFIVSLGVPSYGDPVRDDPIASPIGFLDKQVLHVVLSAAPVGARQEMRREPPGTARCTVPSFPGDVLDHAVRRKGG